MFEGSSLNLFTGVMLAAILLEFDFLNYVYGVLLSDFPMIEELSEIVFLLFGLLISFLGLLFVFFPVFLDMDEDPLLPLVPMYWRYSSFFFTETFFLC